MFCTCTYLHLYIELISLTIKVFHEKKTCDFFFFFWFIIKSALSKNNNMTDENRLADHYENIGWALLVRIDWVVLMRIEWELYVRIGWELSGGNCQVRIEWELSSENKVLWLCLVPTSTTRFASDVGYRMAKIKHSCTRKIFFMNNDI